MYRGKTRSESLKEEGGSLVLCSEGVFLHLLLYSSPDIFVVPFGAGERRVLLHVYKLARNLSPGFSFFTFTAGLVSARFSGSLSRSPPGQHAHGGSSDVRVST